jgi:hypothetical protein
MAIYFNWIREGREDVTKKLLWKHVTNYYEERGLPAPQNRARVLREIGLGHLPEAKSGRRRKKKLAIRYLEWVAGEGFKDGKSR